MATWSCAQGGVREGEKAEVIFYQIGGKKEITRSKTSDRAFTWSCDQDEAVRKSERNLQIPLSEFHLPPEHEKFVQNVFKLQIQP